jgi:hypothetical protein
VRTGVGGAGAPLSIECRSAEDIERDGNKEERRRTAWPRGGRRLEVEGESDRRAPSVGV